MKEIGMGGAAFKILLCRFATAETEEVNLIHCKTKITTYENEKKIILRFYITSFQQNKKMLFYPDS